jgi:hypothetical protein
LRVVDERGRQLPARDIATVCREHTNDLMALPNVNGVAPGENVIRVYVVRKVPLNQLRPDEVIPSTVEGWETDVEEIGEVTPYGGVTE